MFSDASPGILNLPPCKSYPSHHRPRSWQEHTGSWILPWSHFNFTKGVTRGPRWGHERRWLREADDSQAQNVNGGGECEKLRLSVRSRQLGLGEGLNWCQLIHFLVFTLAAENVASRGNYSNFNFSHDEGIPLSWTRDNHRENVQVAFGCSTFARSTDQHCHTRTDLKPHWPQRTQGLVLGNTAAVWFLNSEALRFPAEIVFVLLHKHKQDQWLTLMRTMLSPWPRSYSQLFPWTLSKHWGATDKKTQKYRVNPNWSIQWWEVT